MRVNISILFQFAFFFLFIRPDKDQRICTRCPDTQTDCVGHGHDAPGWFTLYPCIYHDIGGWDVIVETERLTRFGFTPTPLSPATEKSAVPDAFIFI